MKPTPLSELKPCTVFAYKDAKFFVWPEPLPDSGGIPCRGIRPGKDFSPATHSYRAVLKPDTIVTPIMQAEEALIKFLFFTGSNDATPNVEVKITELKRELGKRRSLYPFLIKQGKLTQA